MNILSNERMYRSLPSNGANLPASGTDYYICQLGKGAVHLHEDVNECATHGSGSFLGFKQPSYWPDLPKPREGHADSIGGQAADVKGRFVRLVQPHDTIHL